MKKISPAHVLKELYQKLHAHFGHRNWWPGDTPFEVMVGAILTQNTSWKNVEKALINLKQAQVLTPQALYHLPHHQLAILLRPAGYYNIKAKRLHHFLKYFVEKYQGNATQLFARETETIREELLRINGIGKETADSMLLYAGEKPIFVIDAYTKRIFSRHGLVHEDADYDTVQDLCMTALEPSVTLFNDFHAQIVACGNTYCKRTKPRCTVCPLNSLFEPGIRNRKSCRESYKYNEKAKNEA